MPVLRAGVPTLSLSQFARRSYYGPTDEDGMPDWEGKPPPQHFQGDYFFYHHTDADTMSVLDPDQMDRCSP